MPKIPHEYSRKKEWSDYRMFEQAVRFIRENGVEETFMGRKYIYLYIDDYKYWTMGKSDEALDKTDIINRAKHD